ncbi:MAG: aldo/keto reductase [Lachnospiraceae bacterium]|nr:aldo/keto reductase [Lachnospiraceae bacterium]
MVYKEFQDLKLSALGLGGMRLPVIDGNDARIDEAAAEKMVAYAMEQGINYYDTAWGYHDGNSELVLGKLLSKYPRDSYYLATKFPGYDLSNMDKVEAIFEEQLKKCRTEYFDFYLFHNVCEMNIDAYLDEKYGIHAYLKKQREAGRIRHLGFSAHGSYEVMKRFLEAYGKDMEFCQIQLNWLDWEFQDAKAKLELLKEYHIPVWVMEPLRGGRLAALSEEHAAKLKALRPEEGVPAWAFRFLQSLPEVVVVLSGMSDLNQLKENIRTYETEQPLSAVEMQALYEIAEDMTKKIVLPCTACHYCVSHCPKGLDIPSLLELYNEHSFSGGGFLAPMALMAVPEDKQPSACVGCKSCEAVCPQQIKISEAMSDFHAKLNG